MPTLAIAHRAFRLYTRDMPSHIAHLLFAEELITRCESSAALNGFSTPSIHRFLIFGAQGPDFFYHNQRRQPSGLAYGSLMHRDGYGTAVSFMWKWAVERDLDLSSWVAAWIIGFVSHAILDRYTHPYINAHSGWPHPGKPESERYRSMHPFLERLIDVEMLALHRGIDPNRLGFYDRVFCGEEPPSDWVDMMAESLMHTYPKAADDPRLRTRLINAYLDTMGYYRFTDVIDASYLEDGLRREEAGKVGSNWLSIIHPREVPKELDVLNREGRAWPHPCEASEVSRESFLDRYECALAEGVAVVDAVTAAWYAPVAEGRSRIEVAVANWNLSDGRPTTRPCEKRHAVPLPLAELQDRIRKSIRDGRGGLGV